ncbi:MAG: hypothetical protein OZ930_11805 [Ignavibacteria bacterium]|nr:hypothetical protein [Ignavibacteria bacterium]
MDKDFVENILFELLNQCHEKYGDAVEKIWFYEDELCPSCNKRKIDAVSMGDESALSLNAFMYHDLNTLIGYFLCSYCVTDMFGKGNNQKLLYNKLEENLKTAYHEHIKSQAS